MKSKIALMLCIGTLAVSTIGCADHTEKPETDANSTESETESTALPSETAPSDKSQREMELSKSAFCEGVSTYYKLSDDDAKNMYKKIEDSKILEKENWCLTGAVLNDYDGNGQMDMLVCLYDDGEYSNFYGDGCLYLFMNDDAPYYIYDKYCCYYDGWILNDFGADIDHDGYTEIVFIVQGNSRMGDCQKFVIKYKGNEIERMELPNDFPKDFPEEYDYDSGLSIEIDKDAESSMYSIYCPYLDETILFKPTDDDDNEWSGGNCRGYYGFGMTERDGKQLLEGYESLYAEHIVNVFASAVFLFDWDENGKAYVYDWHVEDWDGRIYVPYDRIQKSVSEGKNLFDKEETGEEVEAYEEFLTGKRTSGIADDMYTDIGYRGYFIEELLNTNKPKRSLLLDDMLARILDETRRDRGVDDINIGVQYALIDCGGDGRKQLALRAYGLGIYSPDDDSDLTMVFDYKDGKVSMIYAVDSWVRGCTELYQNGYARGFGSGGTHHYTWEGMIGANGIYRESYDCYINTGSGLYEMSSCWKVWEDGKFFPVEFYEYTINDETIYAYDIFDYAEITEEERQIILDYIKDNEKQLGTSFLTYDKAWELVEKNRKSLNITDKMNEEQNQINWKTLSVRPSVPQR